MLSWPLGSSVHACALVPLQPRSVTVPVCWPAESTLLAQLPGIPEVSGPAGKVHCWLVLGVLELPVLLNLTWQTAATAREPLVEPVSARHRPSPTLVSTALEPACQRCALVQDVRSSAAGEVDVTAAAAKHEVPTWREPSAATVQCWLVAEPQVSIAMSVEDNAARHLPFEWSTTCPLGPVLAACPIVHAKEPDASVVPDVSVACTLTV